MAKKHVLLLLAAVAVAAAAVSYALAQPEAPRGSVWDRTPGGPSSRPGGPMGSLGKRLLTARERMERTGFHVSVVERMKSACFDPEMAGMLAAGGLREEVERPPEEMVKDLETQLARTKSLGLRNALRMTVREVYKAQGNDEKVLEHLREMLAENDAAIQEHIREMKARDKALAAAHD